MSANGMRRLVWSGCAIVGTALEGSRAGFMNGIGGRDGSGVIADLSPPFVNNLHHRNRPVERVQGRLCEPVRDVLRNGRSFPCKPVSTVKPGRVTPNEAFIGVSRYNLEAARHQEERVELDARIAATRHGYSRCLHKQVRAEQRLRTRGIVED